MNAKTVFSTALVWTMFGLGAVRAQAPGGKGFLDPVVSPGAPMQGPTESGPLPGQKYSVSSWINGDKYACCGEPGTSGPIQTELFFRTGPSLVAGNGQMADVLQTGLYLGAGGRVLFFQPSMEAAWTVEIGLANISNHAHAGNPVALDIYVPQDSANPVTARDSSGNLPPQKVFFGRDAGVPGVTIRQLNRTFFDLGGGKEWYLAGTAASGGTTWRFGFDAGGRWGSASAEFNEIRHRTDVIGGVWAAAHTDVEFPLCGCCIFQAGLRVEYGYTWSDILQIQNKSDVQDINILFSMGVRF